MSGSLIPDYSRQRDVFIAEPEIIEPGMLIYPCCGRFVAMQLSRLPSRLVITRVVPVYASRRDSGRDPSGALNANPFVPAALPGKQLDLTAWNSEVFRQKFNEVAICLAIDGRCCQPDFQAFAMGPVNGVDRSPGLYVDGQHHVFTVPPVPVRSQRRMLHPVRMPRSCLRQGAKSLMGEAEDTGAGSFTSYTPMSG